MMAHDKIAFDHKGIAQALAHNRLRVPLNQREYSWETEHVQDLFSDLKSAIDKNWPAYFLGTVVLTKGHDGRPEVTDGQQRLATITILLAAIRDYLIREGNDTKAKAVEQKFLMTVDYETDEEVPHLRLNVDDNAYFVKRIIYRPGTTERDSATPSRESHRLIDQASRLAEEHVAAVAEYYGRRSIEKLTEWLRFLENGAQVILLTVPDYVNAFSMFETLNDRGLKASQADLLKNHILSLAKDQIEEAQQKWAYMIGTLEATGEDELALTYLRHLVVTEQGPTKERELFGRVKDNINTKGTALKFADALSDGASDYAALFQPQHSKWNEYGPTTRGHIETLLELGVEQIRPLLFAVARRFDLKEGRKAFRMLVAWSVRFLIVGGRGGLLDRNYGSRAQDVGLGRITTARGLHDAMSDVVPSDEVFRTAFAHARVSKAALARYYLRALERCHSGESEPELIPNDNAFEINLEHILPVNPGADWPDILPEAARALYRRIGNLVLLQARTNSAIGNASFKEKKPTLQSSAFALTKEAAKHNRWDETSIQDRQLLLANLAVKTWPLI